MRGVLLAAALAFVAATCVVAWSQPAEAQQFQPNLEIRPMMTGSTEPLAANGPPQPAVFHWVYSFRETTTAALATGSGGTDIRFTPGPACDVPGVIVTGPSSVHVAFTGPGAAPPTAYEGEVTFMVAAGQEAPGETSITCVVHAEAEPVNGQISGAKAAPALFSITVRYMGLVASNVPVTVGEAGPQEQVSFAIDLVNLGNARTTLDFEVVGGNASGGWNPVAPTQVLLESAAQGGAETKTTVHFVVHTPYREGWNNEEATFQLRITPISTLSPDQQGDAIVVNFLARVRGCYSESAAAPESCAAACETYLEHRDGRGQGEAAFADPECEHVLDASRTESSPAAGVALVGALAGAAGLARRRRRA